MTTLRDLSLDDQQRIIRIGLWTGLYEEVEQDLRALGVKPEACEQVRDLLVALHGVVAAQVAVNVASAANTVFAA